MTEFEQKIWAATFAAEYVAEYRFHRYVAHHDKPWDHVGGFSCAEIADIAVEKFREATTGSDKDYLLPVMAGIT